MVLFIQQETIMEYEKVLRQSLEKIRDEVENVLDNNACIDWFISTLKEEMKNLIDNEEYNKEKN